MSRSKIETVIDGAEAHGESSEPDMRIGDLEIALRCAWNLLTPEARTKFLAAVEVVEILGWREG